MKNIINILLLLVLTLSCQKKESPEERKIAVAFQKKRTAFFESFKAPAETAAQLQAIGAVFNANLISHTQNYASYTDDPIKAAANLGLYLADLNYSVAFNQGATTKELFIAAHDLSKVIGIEQGVLDFLMQRYSENISQNDSVKTVISELYDRSTTKLQGTDREKLVGIAMSAYQIENLHLALGTWESYPKDMLQEDTRTQEHMPIFRIVLGQRQHIEIIYGFLQTIVDPLKPEKNPNYAYYANAFEELIGVYRKLNVDDQAAGIQPVELMNDAVLMELSEKVNTIRNKITSV